MVDLSKMSRKQKAEYIWDYYKIHIIGTIVAICVIGFFIHGQLTRVDYVFNMTILSNVSEAQKVKLEKQLTGFVVPSGEKRKQASVEGMPLSSPNSNSKSLDSSMEYQYRQKFIAYVTGGTIDVVVLDKSLFDSLVNQEMFLSLKNVSNLDLSSIKNNKIEAVDGNNNKSIYAIDAQNIKLLKDAGIDTNNKVIGIISTSKQKEKAVEVLKWMLNAQ